jgi:spore germination protein KC
MKSVQHSKIYLFILLIIISLFVSGCWDSQELNRLSILAGLGWDTDPKTGEITITFQSIIPSHVKSSSGSGGSEGNKGIDALQNIQLDHSTGLSPYDALNRFTQHGSRAPFYQQTQVIILGKAGAQKGISNYFDILSRDPASRPNILIAVSEKKASDILEVHDGMENIPAIGIAQEIKLSAQFSKYPAVTILEFLNRSISKTTAPILPMIGIYEEAGPDGKKILKTRITGTAVFKENRMIGELNECESSGLLWVTNKIKKGFVIIPDASLQIIQAKSKIIPELSHDKIRVTIKIHEESNLVEYDGHQDMSPVLLRQLEMAQNREIESQVMAAVQKSFSLDADIFGFGDAVHRRYKNEWKEMKTRWDDIYPDIEVSVKVDTHLNQIGDIKQSRIKD